MTPVKATIFTVLGMGLLSGPMASNAVPVKYDVVYTPVNDDLSGFGSFFWDSEVGAITDFVWELTWRNNVYLGGMGDYYGPDVTSQGHTFGQFAFEILSETDADPVFDCFNSCSIGAYIVEGDGPAGANFFNLIGGINSAGVASPGGAWYEFGIAPGVAFRGLAYVTQSRDVPEPGSLALLGLGLAGLGLSRRRIRISD